MANLSALLSGDVAALGGGSLATLHRALRLACGLCFIGHGAHGVVTDVEWLPLFAAFGVPEWLAWPTMPILGTVDITLGLTVVFHPCRAVLSWMAAWSFLLALLGPFSGASIWSVLAAAANFGPPAIYVWLSSPQRLGWLDRIEPALVPQSILWQVRWALQIMIALVFVGHGMGAALDPSSHLIADWTALGIAADAAFVQWLGSIEILVGLTALFVVTRPFLLSLLYWRLAAELLHMLGGGDPPWHSLQRSGEYLAPLALLCVALLLRRDQGPETAGDRASATTPGIDHLLRIAFSSLVFTASLSTAYAWMRVDLRPRELYFADHAKLLEAGHQYSGWVPIDIPASARLIHEVHDLTTKAAVCSFHVSDPAEFLGYIGRLQENAAKTSCGPPVDLLQAEPHWSSALLFNPQHLQVIANDGRMYAYDADTGQIFSWNCSGWRDRQS